MVIGRNRQTQQFLQQAMNRRCMEQIPTAHDMTYRLNSIVDHDGKMMALIYSPILADHGSLAP